MKSSEEESALASGDHEGPISRKSNSNVVSSQGSENISKQLDNIGTRTFDRLYSFDESSKESDKPPGIVITSYS